MAFNYFFGQQADQYTTLRIPKLLMTDHRFASISIEAKLLYGLLIDRMELAHKNRWIDGTNQIYVLYPITEIQEDMGVSKKKAVACLAELTQFGLIEKKKRGMGLPNLLYIKNFASIFREESSYALRKEV